MNKYDYYIEVANDIESWLDSNDFDLSQFEDREEAVEYLYDTLWAEDSITGNGGCWYDTECQCEEYICHNLDLLFEALFEFGEMEEMLLDNIHKYNKEKSLARWADCTIRCYVLGSAIERALITYEGYGFRYKEQLSGKWNFKKS